MSVFIYMRRTRCSVQLFASDKNLFPKGSVPILKSNHALYPAASRAIGQMMETLRMNRNYITIANLSLEKLFNETNSRSPIACAKFVPTAYTSKGMVYSVAKVEIS